MRQVTQSKEEGSVHKIHLKVPLKNGALRLKFDVLNVQKL